MRNNFWCEKVAYEKISQARRWAEHNRMTLAAEDGKRDTRRAAGSPVAGLLRSLAIAFGLRRPALLSE